MKIFNQNKDNQPYLHASWPCQHVGTIISTRNGGVSQKPYDSMNIAYHVGDDPESVLENRRRLQAQVPVPLVYLNQVHGNQVIDATLAYSQETDGDALIDFSGKLACAIMVADCLPILLCDYHGSCVAAIHGGWRSLAADIIEQTIIKMAVDPQHISAYLGPCISEYAFEVGEDVYQAFYQGCLKNKSKVDCAFQPIEKKYLANIPLLATYLLRQAGVQRIYSDQFCTVIDKEKFFSYRRDGKTGRMLAAIWLQDKNN